MLQLTADTIGRTLHVYQDRLEKECLHVYSPFGGVQAKMKK